MGQNLTVLPRSGLPDTTRDPAASSNGRPFVFCMQIVKSCFSYTLTKQDRPTRIASR
jgi:hypothetical protein